jgi:histidine triad (HIT) family protein
MSQNQDDCSFCRIVDGEIPARTVYEDDDVLAFLDVNPLAPGHTLVIPRAHDQFLRDVPADLSAAVFGTVHDLVGDVEDAVDADAHTVAVNDGPAAGQEVPHMHVHIVPRFDGDGGGPIHAIAGTRPELDEAELDRIAEDVRG